MHSEYQDTCSKIENGIEHLRLATVTRAIAFEATMSLLSCFTAETPFSLTAAKDIRETVATCETAARVLRDETPNLVQHLQDLQRYFVPVETPEEKKSLFRRLGFRGSKSQEPPPAAAHINPQEVFERAYAWNLEMLTQINDFVTFVDEATDALEEALVEPKAFVIEVMKNWASIDRDSEAGRVLTAQKFYAEEVISMCERHALELTLMKREFTSVVASLRKNEEVQKSYEDDVINVAPGTHLSDFS